MDRKCPVSAPDSKAKRVLATFEQKYACKFPCAYALPKKKKKFINQKPLHYLSSALILPYDQSIHVKSCSFGKSTSFYGHQPSEFCLGEKEMLDSELYNMCTGEACGCTPMPTACSSYFTSLVPTRG